MITGRTTDGRRTAVGNHRVSGRWWASNNNIITVLEGHSVERIYLQQRSSDGSMNKTILKPRLALTARRIRGIFPYVKFRVVAQLAGSLSKAAKFRRIYDIGESNLHGSGIRTMIWIGLKC